MTAHLTLTPTQTKKKALFLTNSFLKILKILTQLNKTKTKTKKKGSAKDLESLLSPKALDQKKMLVQME